MSKPYVVSADIYLLLQQWAAKRGFTLPPPEFFAELRRKFTEFFTSIFPTFELIPEQELVKGIAALVPANRFSVCLERAYYSHVADFVYEACRSTPDALPGEEFLRERVGAPELHIQSGQLREKLKNSWKPGIVLVDDMLFTGRLLKAFSKSSRGKPVMLTCVGVEVEIVGANGSRWFREQTGLEVRSVRRYGEVIDAVCERDFYPGVPLSGRLSSLSYNWRAPYVFPFGKPTEWASIPPDEVGIVSVFCIQQTIALFAAIEKASQKEVMTQDIEGNIIRIWPCERRFTDELRRVAAETFGKDFPASRAS